LGHFLTQAPAGGVSVRQKYVKYRHQDGEYFYFNIKHLSVR